MELAGQLSQIYTAKVYPVLARHDPRYRAALKNAGLGWTGTATMTAIVRKAFEEEMRKHAWYGAREIARTRSLEPSTVRVKLLTGAQTLYRVGDSTRPSSTSIWWFTERVAGRCRMEAGAQPEDRLNWLRNVLAVCYNWSKFDRLEQLQLRAGEELPAILGRGLPMPYHLVQPYIDRKTGETMVSIPDEYWKRKGQMLFGGELQTVLPWIPTGRVRATPSF